MENNTPSVYRNILELQKTGIIPKVFNIPEGFTKVVVHKGNFHLDDVAVVAFLKECYNPDIEVCRVDKSELEQYVNDETCIIADIGNVFDKRRRFDHHQIPINKPKADLRASIGLLWDTYGNQVYHHVTSLIRTIDAHDCDPIKYRSQLSVSFAAFNPWWGAESDEYDLYFDNAVDMFRQFVRATVVANNHTFIASKEIESNMKIINNGKAMVIYTNAPYKSIIRDYPSVRFVARPMTKDNGEKHFSCQCVNGWEFDRAALKGMGVNINGWNISCKTEEDVAAVSDKLINLKEGR